MKKSPTTPALRPVVVCTDKRGVFFGYLDGTPAADPLRLTRPRMCVRWSADVRGVLGLAATGPSASCRITAAPPAIELRGVTCVMDCTPEAAAKWEAQPWA